MEVQTFYPADIILKQHIEYYYFLKTDFKMFSEEYYAFPNTNHSFNIHKNAGYEFGENYAYVYESNRSNFLTIIQGKYETPLLVRLRGRLDKLTIVFKPLGINHFITESFASVAGKPSQIFSQWKNDALYPAFLRDFYSTNDNTTRVEYLERFLLAKYHELKRYSLFNEAVKQLNNFDKELSIENIAKSTGMHVRTFNRLFYQELGITPAGFRKIARFRHSLQNKLLNNRFKKLIEICYESNFYDQPYFNKIYKNLTTETPGKFFKSIDKLADDHLILKFLSH